MLKSRANTLAALVAALACSGALAEQAAPASTNKAPQQPAQTKSAAQQPAQQGVVYPGRPIVNSTTPAPQGAPLPGGAAQTGAPGEVIGQVPALPPMPGGGGAAPVRRMTPSQLYVEDNMPADLPAAIELYKRRFDEAQRAAAQYSNNAPKPRSSTITVTQAPGEQSPPVRLASGVPTNIVFTDSTGAPWPIEFATPGDNTIVDVLIPVEGSSMLQIRPKTPYMYGAVSVSLKGNPVPVTLILGSAQKEVDTRIDIRVARRGPNAQAPIIDRPGFTQVDNALLAILDGVPPSDSRAIRTSSGEVSAWAHKNRLYVRTRLPVVSPAYSETASSVDGMRVYITPLVPFVTVSADGLLQNVRIGD